MSTSSAMIPGAEPLSVDAGELGVLLCHGFTGSPVSMKPWGQHLADRGHSVRVPLLPGHGTRWRDLQATGWTDWYAHLERAFDELSQRCSKVAVAGLSMGGCLALRLAEQRPDEVAAVVLVNPAIAMKRFDLRLVPLLKHLVPSVAGIGNDIKAPRVTEGGYDRTPLKALDSQMQMWRDVRRNLDRVTAPLLLLRSEEDHVVDATSRELILAGVSSEHVRDVPLRNSFHVATLDHDADLIHRETDAFLAEHLGVPT